MVADGELPLGRRTGKSEAAFRTISEVAEELDVPQHVLRFWESKFPQVKPLKRGGGRRYYRPEDVALLRRIRDLLYSEGYTIKGVQKLLREGGYKGGPSQPSDTDDLPQSELDLELGTDTVREDDEGVRANVADDEGEGPSLGSAGMDETSEVPVTGPSNRLPPATRRELEGILEDLEQLRCLLQPRER